MKDRGWIIDVIDVTEFRRGFAPWQVRYRMPGYSSTYMAYGMTRFSALRAAAFARRSYIVRDLTAKLTQ